jgi:hypothetical protein
MGLLDLFWSTKFDKIESPDGWIWNDLVLRAEEILLFSYLDDDNWFIRGDSPILHLLRAFESGDVSYLRVNAL